MKAFIKIMLLPISLWTACTNSQKQTRDFIPGIYVTQAKSEYSIASDTLVIAKTGNNYAVTRKTGFHRIASGQLMPEAHKAKSFTGIWDAQKQTLQLSENGIIILFQPAANQLEVQNSKYRKL
jgi:hypothetical protein